MKFKTITLLLFFSILIVPSCRIEYSIEKSTFYNGVLFSSEMWDVVSTISLDTKSYVIYTTDNSHGQMNKRLSENGNFVRQGRKVYFEPEIRLIPPDQIPGRKSSKEVVYTNEEKTDSFYINIIQSNQDISEFVYISKDSLSPDNISLLGFNTRIYLISNSNGKTILTNQINPGDVFYEYNFKK
jgi:hypothetical protein